MDRNRARAQILGLAVPTRAPLPRWIREYVTADGERRVDARIADDVGSETRRRIGHDLDAVGLDVASSWIYAETHFGWIEGRRVAVNRLALPDHRGGMVASPVWHEPHQWLDGHDQFRLEAIGHQLRTPAEVETCPVDVRYAIGLHDGPQGTLLLAALRRRSVHLGSRAYALADWRPGWPEPEITHGGIGHNERKLRDAVAAEQLLREFEFGSQDGRPEDTGLYDDASEPRFFEDLGKAAHTAVRAGEPLSYASLGRHGLGDRRTAKKYVERFEYDLTKIEAEAIRCTHRLVLCQFHVRRMADFKKKRV